MAKHIKIYKKSESIGMNVKVPFNLVLIGFFLFIVVCGFFIFDNKPSTGLLRPVPENEKTEMREIPPDVKVSLKDQALVSSATLPIPMLMYHYVEYVADKKDTERQSLDVTPFAFEEQIKTLLGAGYTFITAKDLGDILDGKTAMPARPIILTFDDGHWDLDTVVLPILKKYNIHATAYVVPGFIGTNSDSLTVLQMKDVVNSGLIDVGAHTVHHAYLKGLSQDRAAYEINQSKSMLENTYNIKVYSFAYPYGAFDQQAINIVKQAGFTTAASTLSGEKQSQQNRFFLYRIRPGYHTGQDLLSYIKYWESVTPKVN